MYINYLKTEKEQKHLQLSFVRRKRSLETTFINEVFTTFTNKMKQAEYEIIRADLSQENPMDKINEEVALYDKKKALFLAGIARKEGFGSTKRSLTTGLVLCKDSNWNW